MKRNVKYGFVTKVGAGRLLVRLAKVFADAQEGKLLLNRLEVRPTVGGDSNGSGQDRRSSGGTAGSKGSKGSRGSKGKAHKEKAADTDVPINTTDVDKASKDKADWMAEVQRVVRIEVKKEVERFLKEEIPRVRNAIRKGFNKREAKFQSDVEGKVKKLVRAELKHAQVQDSEDGAEAGKEPETDNEGSDGDTTDDWPGGYCNRCADKIVGSKYTCVDPQKRCEDFDVCEACEANYFHEHPMQKYKVEIEPGAMKEYNAKDRSSNQKKPQRGSNVLSC